MGINGSFITPFHRIPHSPMRKTVETAKKLSSFSVEQSTGKKRATKEANWFDFLFSLPGRFYKSLSEYFITNEIIAGEHKALSPAINMAFFDRIKSILQNEIGNPVGDAARAIIESEDMIIARVLWNDLGRTDMNLIDENGKTISINVQSKNDSIQQGKTEVDWKKEQVTILREFFGYDKNKDPNHPDNLDADTKLYRMSLNCGPSFQASFIEASQPFEKNFFNIPARHSHLEQVYTLSKDTKNNFTLTCKESTTFDLIMDLKNNKYIHTDASKSKKDRKIGITLLADDRWAPYEGGYDELTIVEAKEQPDIG